MSRDGIEHAIAFSQYPQWCCNTSGSSYNHLWRVLRQKDMTQRFKWTVIDRWFLSKGYIDALIDKVVDSIKNEFTVSERRNLCLLFSAHSIPMKSVQKGDPYVFEVSSTVKTVMDVLSQRVKSGEIEVEGLEDAVPHHQLSWQSKVGFLPWMTPSTEDVVKAVGDNKRYQNLLVIPFVFTSDHIETLYELDVEYKHLAEKHGVTKYVRCGALNDSQIFIEALADIVSEHIHGKVNHSEQYKLRCHGCTNEDCRRIENPLYAEQEERHSMQSKAL